MGLLSGILLLVLTVILCMSVFASSELTASAVLDALIEHPEDEVVDEKGRPCFVFSVSPAGMSWPAAYEDRIFVYGEKSVDILTSAVRTGNGKFEAGGFYFRVRSFDRADDTTVYAVIDRTADRQNLLTIGGLTAVIYVTALIVAVLFFYLYSSYALAPVGESMKKQRDLVANASHELKTPLTVIATNLAVMKSEPASTVAENAKWMDAIEAQIKRMNGLIVNMLQLSKMENVPLDLKDIDLSELAEGACLGFDAVCFEKGLRLITKITPGIRVMGDKDSLERLIAGLLDNATKYSEKDGKIGLRLITDGKRAKMFVMNTGEAMTPEDSKHAFDRFYRSDGARSNPDGNSFGLGLAIARATVTAHGGSISCRGINGKGTVFEVTLPLSKTSVRGRNQGEQLVSDSAAALPADCDFYEAERGSDEDKNTSPKE